MAGKNKSGSLPFPGVAEGFDLVRKVWGVTGLPMLPTPSSMAQFATRLPQTLPSMIAPTLDVEELDKRIADLRAVEQWLNLNVSMLRTTVQSLEVQRNTIATLKSFGGAMLSAGAAQQAATPVSAENWPYPAGQPTAPPAVAPATTPAASAAPTPRMRGARRKQAAGTHPAAALPLNPTVWWNTLQEQFTKIATAAAAEAQAAAKADARSKAAGEPEPVKKPAARKRRARPVKAA